MVATTDKLSALHGALADTMNDALDAEVRRIELTKALFEVDISDLDEETAKHLSTALTLAPTARVDNALLKTISAFLKDNNITTDLDNGDAESETQAALEKMAQKRRRVAMPTDMMN